MTAARVLVALFVLTVCAQAADRVRIAVFGLFHPCELTVEALPSQPLLVGTGATQFVLGDGGPDISVRSAAGKMTVRTRDRRLTSAEVSIRGQHTDAAEFVLSVPGKLRRRFRGQLTIISDHGQLRPVVEMDVETAVASIVAAELPTDDTPPEALKAQAVVARSYLLASAPRHDGADFCDTTHCQFLREPPPQASPAARAAAATRGLVLAWRGKPFAAMYSASCNGHTHSLAEIGAAPRGYPYFGVACPYCRRAKGAASPDGHGLGLCQRGAAGMARDGADFRTILQHYFPNTTLGNSPAP